MWRTESQTDRHKLEVITLGFIAFTILIGCTVVHEVLYRGTEYAFVGGPNAAGLPKVS